MIDGVSGASNCGKCEAHQLLPSVQIAESSVSKLHVPLCKKYKKQIIKFIFLSTLKTIERGLPEVKSYVCLYPVELRLEKNGNFMKFFMLKVI